MILFYCKRGFDSKAMIVNIKFTVKISFHVYFISGLTWNLKQVGKSVSGFIVKF